MGDRHIRAIRRGVALGLALVGLWGLGLTTSAEELLERFVAWEEQSHLAVEVLAAQLGGPSPREQALSGWPRLLLWQSPLLAAGEQAVLDLRRQPPPAAAGGHFFRAGLRFWWRYTGCRPDGRAGNEPGRWCGLFGHGHQNRASVRRRMLCRVYIGAEPVWTAHCGGGRVGTGHFNAFRQEDNLDSSFRYRKYIE